MYYEKNYQGVTNLYAQVLNEGSPDWDNTYTGGQNLGDKKKKSKEQLQYVAEQMALKAKWAEKELEAAKKDAADAKKAVDDRKDEEAEDDPELGQRADKTKTGA